MANDFDTEEDKIQGTLPFLRQLDSPLKTTWHSDCDESLHLVLRQTQGTAANTHQPFTTIEHLLLALTTTQASASELVKAGVDVSNLHEDLLKLVHRPFSASVSNDGPPQVSHALAALVLRARASAREDGREICGVRDLLAALREALVADRIENPALEALAARWPDVRKASPFMLIAEQLREVQAAVIKSLSDDFRAQLRSTSEEFEKRLMSHYAREKALIADEVTAMKTRLKTIEHTVTAVAKKSLGRKMLEANEPTPPIS